MGLCIIMCLGVEYAQSALEKADCTLCERFATRKLRSCLAHFSSAFVPRGSGSLIMGIAT